MNEKIIFEYIDMMAERTADKLFKKLSKNVDAESDEVHLPEGWW